MCHVCSKVYCQGATLSRHLKQTHQFEWPSGHSRFRYKLDLDGFYRLQTLRYESIELSEQLNKSKMTTTTHPNPNPNPTATHVTTESSLTEATTTAQSEASSMDVFAHFDAADSLTLSTTQCATNTNTLTLPCTPLKNQFTLPIANMPSNLPFEENLLLVPQRSNSMEDGSGSEVGTQFEAKYSLNTNTNSSAHGEGVDSRVGLEFDLEHFLNENFTTIKQDPTTAGSNNDNNNSNSHMASHVRENTADLDTLDTIMLI